LTRNIKVVKYYSIMGALLEKARQLLNIHIERKPLQTKSVTVPSHPGSGKGGFCPGGGNKTSGMLQEYDPQSHIATYAGDCPSCTFEFKTNVRY
jgi:hypothetical protein